MAALLGIARAGRVLNTALAEVRTHALPGVTTGRLDALTQERLAQAGARPAMLGYRDDVADAPFPAALSVCINDEIMGASDPDRVLRAGDLVTADLVVELSGWHADAAASWVVPGAHPAGERRAHLARASAAVTRAGVEALGPGAPWERVVRAMNARAASLGVEILPGYDGHAVGRSMHAPPRLACRLDELDATGGRGLVLRPGMVLTIEPVVVHRENARGAEPVREGWLDRTGSGCDACFTEVTAAVGAGRGPGKRTSLLLAGISDRETC